MSLKNTLIGTSQDFLESKIDSVKDTASNAQNLVPDLKNFNKNDIGKTLSDAKNVAGDVKNAINNVKGTANSIKDSILKNKNVPTDAVDKLKNVANLGKDKLEGAIGNLGNLKDVLGGNELFTDGLSQLQNSIDTVKGAIDKFKSIKPKIDGLTGFVDFKDSDNSQTIKLVDITSEEAMKYDDNGLKHFINLFLDELKNEKINFTLQGGRRWAVNRDDEKVFGNAFLKQQTEEAYKTLDSDGKYYWLSDYNSRHYYGEAVDIAGELDGLLESIAKNDKVLNIMHQFGICMQVETSQSGHSKGTHFHCSTDPNKPQTKWWGIVNKIRQKNGLKLYTVVSDSQYTEKETANKVEIA